MNSSNYSLSSLLTELAFIICVLTRCLTLAFEWGSAANYVFYLLILLMLILTAHQSFKEASTNKAEFKSSLKGYALCASIGFLVDFVNLELSALNLAEGKHYSKAELLALCFAGVFALLSSLYFSAVYLSCKSAAYDFKKLKFLHFTPLIWALLRSTDMISNATSVKSDVYSALKGAVLIFAILFFYSFISELENKSEAKRTTLFFSGAFSYLAFLLFISSVLSLIFKKADLISEESFFSLSAFLIGLFVYYFRKELFIFNF